MTLDGTGAGILVVVQPASATILVVDHDDDVRRGLVDAVGEDFGRVIEAPSAEVALVVCRARSVDVVAASAHLPRRGVDALRRELVVHRGPPVVAYSAPTPTPRSGSIGPGAADRGADGALVAARCRAAVQRSPRPSRLRLASSGRRRIVPGILRWR